MLETKLAIPTPMDIIDATPRDRAPYIAAQKAIDYAVRIAASEGMSRNEAMPRIKEAFADLNQGMLEKTLDPPIEQTSDLGGLIADFNQVYRQQQPGVQLSVSESATALDALYLVVDHGNRPGQVPKDGA